MPIMKYGTNIWFESLTTPGVISSPEIEKYDLAALHACNSDDLPEGYGICDPLGELSKAWCVVVDANFVIVSAHIFTHLNRPT